MNCEVSRRVSSRKRKILPSLGYIHLVNVNKFTQTKNLDNNIIKTQTEISFAC